MKELKKDVIEFLFIAKEKTYISEDSTVKEKLEDTSTIMKYTEGIYTYRDHYYGGEPYIGNEIVFENNIPIWGMNHHGRASDKL